MDMRKITSIALMFLLHTVVANAQNFCNANANIAIYSNYDGGKLVIDVDTPIINLKIGIVSYEADSIILQGAYLNNVTAVEWAGYNGTNNHCPGQSPTATVIVGSPVTPVYSQIVPVTYSNPYGYLYVICNYSCDVMSSQGGCNTADQISDYFFNQFGTNTLLFHYTQYGCWTGTRYISEGGNCCAVPLGTTVEEELISVDNGNGIYEFTSQNASNVKIVVYDFSGREVVASEFYKNKKMDLSFLPTGIYLLNAYSGNKTISRKIIVE
jgi:hypothetical protein